MRLAVILLVVAGCGVADFDVTQPIIEQRVQGSALPGPLGMLFPLPLSLDLSAKIKQQNSGPIDGVTLSSLTLSITKTAEPSGDTDDWSFVDSIDVYVSSSKSGSTLPKLKLAHVASPGTVRTLNFIVESGVNLKPYVEEGSVVEGTATGRAPQDDETYDGVAVFTVHPL
ncbi:MAG: hypothetical protein JWO36_1470 [Myxococcales bacterium]|nr:hypothetical protein [Myxococcales bacterium]